MHRAGFQTVSRHLTQQRHHIYSCSQACLYTGADSVHGHFSGRGRGRTPTTTISPAFLLHHLLCSTDDDIKIQPVTPLFGLACFHTSGRRCPSTHKSCSRSCVHTHQIFDFGGFGGCQTPVWAPRVKTTLMFTALVPRHMFC